MAKQTVGPLVRHVEKVVLAICAGGLFYVVAMFGALSPNKVDVNGELVGPKDVDRAVREAAEALRDRVVRAEPPPIEIEDPMPRLRVLEDVLAFAKVDPVVPAPVPPSPALDVDITPTDNQKVQLAEVVPLSRPVVTAMSTGRSGLILAPPTTMNDKAQSGGSSSDAFLQDVNWVTVAAAFDLSAQFKRCEQVNYPIQRRPTLFLRSELQRRTQQPDGAWGPWSEVVSITEQAQPELPTVTVFETERTHNVYPEEKDQVTAFLKILEAPGNQLALVRPLFPDIRYGDPWRYPKLDNLDILTMDAEYQETAGCRYPECAAADDVIDTSLSVRKLLEEAVAQIEKGAFERGRAYIETASKKGQGNAQNERQVADVEKKLERAIADASLKAGTRSPIQVLSAHDAGIGSLQSGRAYQYRMRPVIYNRYCTLPTLLQAPKDAEKVVLKGPWSEPSDPIVIPQDTMFFVKSARERNGELKVEIFKWVKGYWIKQAFNVGIGERIGDVKNTSLPPDGQRDRVNFDTGSEVVDIDFAHSYREPPDTRTGQPGEVIRTAALVYVDPAGQLHEQLLDFDKGSEAYKNMRGLEWKD